MKCRKKTKELPFIVFDGKNLDDVKVFLDGDKESTLFIKNEQLADFDDNGNEFCFANIGDRIINDCDYIRSINEDDFKRDYDVV